MKVLLDSFIIDENALLFYGSQSSVQLKNLKNIW